MVSLKRTLVAMVAASTIVTGSALLARAADQTAFVGPTGWSHADASPGSGSTLKIEKWHVPGDDAQSLTLIVDPNTSYADALAAIAKNLAANRFKAAIDKDEPCHGVQAHVVEFTFGPDGHQIVINRTLLPDGTGVETITYSRAQGNPFDDDVRKSITTFCAST